jgi:serine/threonine protein kinase
MLWALCMANVTMAGYVLGELLGRGGMGAVYAARQPSLDRTVAVKLLHPELATVPGIVDRFRTEALAGSRLSHPNVARVLDFGVSAEGTPFLVMEHVAGERLGRILEREGPLTGRRACALVCQILRALDAAHMAGVVHADVKSDNVLVNTGRDGHDIAILIDFGIARLADRPSPDDDAAEHILSGTPEYLAPEVIAGTSPTAASDLYATGVVLYELLTGETPFHGGSAAAIFQRHLDEEAIAPSLRCPDAAISTELDRVVLRALAKDPTMRYASAAQFATALTAAMPAGDRARPLDGLRPTGFSTEAPTQDWPAAPRRRFAEGTHPQPTDRAEQLRSAIGASIVAGDINAIASSYLELARSLVAERHADIAVWELEQAVDVLTAGDGPATETPPSPLWRVLLALATIYDGIGEARRARTTARHAWRAANQAHSPTGRNRASALLQKLAQSTAS